MSPAEPTASYDPSPGHEPSHFEIDICAISNVSYTNRVNNPGLDQNSPSRDRRIFLSLRYSLSQMLMTFVSCPMGDPMLCSSPPAQFWSCESRLLIIPSTLLSIWVMRPCMSHVLNYSCLHVFRCMASPRWDALTVLFIGAVYQAFAYTYNLGHVTWVLSTVISMRYTEK